MVADLATFFNTDDFAVSCTYTPKGATAKTVNVVPEEESGDACVLQIQVSDVAAPGKGDTAAIAGVTWYVVGIASGGTAESIWHVRCSKSARFQL
jgi:hypothetical protein